MRAAFMRRICAALVKGVASVVVLAWTSPTSADAERTMAIGCQIRVAPRQDAVRLDAIAIGRRSTRGQYRLEVFKESPAGTSQNVQSGAFSLEADQEAFLTTVVLDGSALGHYRARLILQSDFGNSSCVSP
jgi:hypothetical protein